MSDPHRVGDDDDDADEPLLEGERSGGLMEAPVTSRYAGGDIDEDVVSEDKPLVRREIEANIRLRGWIVIGLGGLLGLILLMTPIIVLVRPGLTGFASTYLQITLAGLVGLAGTVVGFLFARDKDR